MLLLLTSPRHTLSAIEGRSAAGPSHSRRFTMAPVRNQYMTVGLSILAGTALGAVAIQTLHAQAKPLTYVIAEITVEDQDGYTKEYVPLITKSIQESGGKFLAARKEVPKAEAVIIGDLDTIAGAKDVATQVNAIGHFDAVIHNAAVGYREPQRTTADGVPHLFAINTLSVYILTALIQRPKRLVYLSSGMHLHTEANLDDVLWKKRRWNGSTAYAESKLQDAMFAFAVARRWPNVSSNSLEPGWVATKMGGAGAPGDLTQAHLTQAWLAARDDPKADITGQYFFILNAKSRTRRLVTSRCRISSFQCARKSQASLFQPERSEEANRELDWCKAPFFRHFSKKLKRKSSCRRLGRVRGGVAITILSNSSSARCSEFSSRGHRRRNSIPSRLCKH